LGFHKGDELFDQLSDYRFSRKHGSEIGKKELQITADKM